MKSTRRNNFPRDMIVLLGIAIAIFLALLGRRDIVTAHEARVAQTARTMSASGWPWNAKPVDVPVSGLIDTPAGKRLVTLPVEGSRAVNPWLVPVINGQIRLQKPPLPYWCAAVLFRLFEVSEFNARLVPALLGALATLLIYDLARIILGRRAAIPAALVWITTEFVVDEYRKAMADPYLAFFTLLAIWCWIRGGGFRAILFYVAIGFGLLAKGPPIFVTLVPAVAMSFVLPRRSTRRNVWSLHLLGLLLLFAIALPWCIYIVRNLPHSVELWRYESLGEFGENAEKARPWWLYAATIVQLALPWTPIWIAAMIAPFTRGKARMKSRRMRRRWFLIGWLVITIAIFSLANVKKNAYLLPVMPALTLLVADALVTMWMAARRTKLRALAPVLAGMQAAIGIGFGAGMFVMLWRERSRGIGASALIISILSIVLALAAIAPISRRSWKNWFIAQCGAYVLMMIVLVSFHRAVIDNARSPKAFAPAVADYSEQSGVALLVGQLPEEASFYMPLNLPDGSQASRVLILIDHSPKDPPASAKLLSNLLDGATIREFQRVKLNVDDGGNRYQLFDVIVDRENHI